MAFHNRRGGMRSANASDNEGASGDDLSVDIEQTPPPSSEAMPTPLAPVSPVRKLPPLEWFLQRAPERPGTLPMGPEGFDPLSLSVFTALSDIDTIAQPPWLSSRGPYELPLLALPPSAYQSPEMVTQRNRAPVFPEKGSQSSSASDQRYCKFCKGT
jgi:hypothetical protein